MARWLAGGNCFMLQHIWGVKQTFVGPLPGSMGPLQHCWGNFQTWLMEDALIMKYDVELLNFHNLYFRGFLIFDS